MIKSIFVIYVALAMVLLNAALLNAQGEQGGIGEVILPIVAQGASLLAPIIPGGDVVAPLIGGLFGGGGDSPEPSGEIINENDGSTGNGTDEPSGGPLVKAAEVAAVVLDFAGPIAVDVGVQIVPLAGSLIPFPGAAFAFDAGATVVDVLAPTVLSLAADALPELAKFAENAVIPVVTEFAENVIGQGLNFFADLFGGGKKDEGMTEPSTPQPPIADPIYPEPLIPVVYSLPPSIQPVLDVPIPVVYSLPPVYPPSSIQPALDGSPMDLKATVYSVLDDPSSSMDIENPILTQEVEEMPTDIDSTMSTDSFEVGASTEVYDDAPLSSDIAQVREAYDYPTKSADDEPMITDRAVEVIESQGFAVSFSTLVVLSALFIAAQMT
jgi:hypothetical protein